MSIVGKKQKGFTIVELLIVIVVIGVLAAITTVAYNGIQNRAKVSKSSADLKAISSALTQYYYANNKYPCFDHAWDDTKEIAWSKPYISWPSSPWGGHYHWEHQQSYLLYSISVENPGQANAQAIDSSIDDGNLSTGKVIGNGFRIEVGMMDQSVPLNDCHI